VPSSGSDTLIELERELELELVELFVALAVGLGVALAPALGLVEGVDDVVGSGTLEAVSFAWPATRAYVVAPAPAVSSIAAQPIETARCARNALVGRLQTDRMRTT
jgi:hypothetical protein